MEPGQDRSASAGQGWAMQVRVVTESRQDESATPGRGGTRHKGHDTVFAVDDVDNNE